MFLIALFKITENAHFFKRNQVSKLKRSAI